MSVLSRRRKRKNRSPLNATWIQLMSSKQIVLQDSLVNVLYWCLFSCTFALLEVARSKLIDSLCLSHKIIIVWLPCVRGRGHVATTLLLHSADKQFWLSLSVYSPWVTGHKVYNGLFSKDYEILIPIFIKVRILTNNLISWSRIFNGIKPRAIFFRTIEPFLSLFSFHLIPTIRCI